MVIEIVSVSINPTPIAAPNTVAEPPYILTPPIIVAATTVISQPVPAAACAVANLADDRIPANAHKVPEMIKAKFRILLILIPQVRAVSGLPPAAIRERPYTVYFKTHAAMKAIANAM